MSKSRGSSSTSTKVAVDSEHLSYDNKIKASQLILEVKDEIADVDTLKTNSGLPVDVAPFEFSGLSSTTDTFSISKFLTEHPHKLNTAYQMVTDSLKMNKLKKKGVVQKVPLFKDFNILIIPSIRPVEKAKNVFTFNRAMALAVAIIRYNLTGKKFDWSTGSYTVSTDTKSTGAPINSGNKIALSIGLPPTHDLYWFYASGFEHTFELYPVEALGTALFRLAYKKSLRLEKMDDIDIMKSVLAQMSKKGDIKHIFHMLKPERIAEVINNLASSRTDIATVRFDTIIKLFNGMASLIENKDDLSFKLSSKKAKQDDSDEED